MKRLLSATVLLTVAGLSCIIAAYFCHFYYTLYRDTSTRLEQNVDSRINGLQQEVDRLAEQKHFTTIRAEGVILTSEGDTNHPASDHATNPGEYQLSYGKGGWHISRELRLPAGSLSLHEFDITLSPAGTRVLDAWVSPPGQPGALALFETLSARANEGTNSFKLAVRAKPGPSTNYSFTVIVLRDTSE